MTPTLNPIRWAMKNKWPKHTNDNCTILPIAAFSTFSSHSIIPQVKTRRRMYTFISNVQEGHKLIIFSLRLHFVNVTLSNKYPRFIMGPLAQAKNGVERFWTWKFHAANGKAQHALKVPWFFCVYSLGGWGGWDGGFFFIFPLLLTCSQWVLIRFPRCSLGFQCVPQGCSQ